MEYTLGIAIWTGLMLFIAFTVQHALKGKKDDK